MSGDMRTKKKKKNYNPQTNYCINIKQHTTGGCSEPREGGKKVAKTVISSSEFPINFGFDVVAVTRCFYHTNEVSEGDLERRKS